MGALPLAYLPVCFILPSVMLRTLSGGSVAGSCPLVHWPTVPEKLPKTLPPSQLSIWMVPDTPRMPFSAYQLSGSPECSHTIMALSVVMTSNVPAELPGNVTFT